MANFIFHMEHPSGALADTVQALWSARVQAGEPVRKRLYSDAGTGVLFFLTGEVCVAEQRLTPGVIMQPQTKAAVTIDLSPGTELVGVHFHPAMGAPLITPQLTNLEPLASDATHHRGWYQLYHQLKDCSDDQQRLALLSAWSQKLFAQPPAVPAALTQALAQLCANRSLSDIAAEAQVSQRQLERQCQQWLGMTPKYYQRLMRVRAVVDFLRQQPHTDLVDAALAFGFSDQAHMTREFRALAGTTPKKR